jgi:2'-5' RNA ligase
MKIRNQLIRAFVAISLPQTIKQELSDFQDQLKKSNLSARFTNPFSLHVTLKFLGDIETAALDQIKICMEKAAADIPVHTLFASGLGVFPSVRNAKILWAGIGGQTDVLELISKKLDPDIFQNFGNKKETNRFSPHLTLARIKSPVPPEQVAQLIEVHENFKSQNFSVSGMQLYKSTLRPSGARHDSIYSVSFKGIIPFGDVN